MGFLDKAKQMAEQAQSKLDEVQKQFNESQGSGAQPQAPPVEYDKHGRPVRQDEPASTTPPPAPPAAAAPTPDPAAPSAEDRNHPSYAPPKLTSGDPLAG